MRTQLKYYSQAKDYDDDEQAELERQKQAILNFQKLYAEQRAGFRPTWKGFAIFFAKVVVGSFVFWWSISWVVSFVKKHV